MTDYFEIIFIVGAIIIVFVFIAIIVLARNNTPVKPTTWEDYEQKKAGRLGEKYASSLIKKVLKENDTLLTNVKITVDGKRAEIDNIVINNRGIFLIEVKNYSGVLLGKEDDYEWLKIKESSGGENYQKIVKNPIKQVNRQVYLLSHFLKQYGYNVWIDGYVFLVQRNSPVDSKKVLSTLADMNNAIHYGTDNKIPNSVKDKIIDLLS